MREEELDALEAQLGAPRKAATRLPMVASEFDILLSSMRTGRWEDATLVIPRGDGFVCTVKHRYPPGVARIPSGGVGPDEAIEDAAVREAREETGLVVALRRYVLRADALFRCGAETRRWRSHVFLAEATGGTLVPFDTFEVKEVRVHPADELVHDVHPRMLATGLGGFAYRVWLERGTLRAL